jgi:hypothetical protein
MLNNQSYRRFRLYFQKDFLYPEILDEFGDYMKESSHFFKHPIDYINSTITTARIPGIIIPSTDKQIHQAGQQGREWRGGTPLKEQITKEIVVGFKLKEAFLNWMVLYRMCELYYKGEQAFLPPVRVYAMDHDDSIIMVIEFYEIILKRLDDLRLSSSDSNIGSKDFELTIGFNKYDVKFLTNQKVNKDIPVY